MKLCVIFGMALLGLASPPGRGEKGGPYFSIEVIDEQTGRGVPLVGLETVNAISHYTDSAGRVAFNEPGLMGKRVYFFVKSHGYEYPKDGFGYAGVALKPTAGGKAMIKVKRTNIAERLYRITGEGIYRDSTLLGHKPPITQPLINGLVMGQDSVMAVLYREKIYWFWGDTVRVAYPLGQFRVSGATSELPERGGLDPSAGVDLHYFVDNEGFSRPMCPLPDRPEGPVWIDGLMVLPGADGRPVLAAHYARMKNLGEMLEHGLVVFDDSKETFQRHTEFDLKEPWRCPQGHPIGINEGGQDYYVFCRPFPSIRVRAELKMVADPSQYEAFTCLPQGNRYDKAASMLERDAAGQLVWGWKTATDPIGQNEERELIATGRIKPEESRFQLRDADSGKPVRLAGGSFCYNEFRHKWIMIGCEIAGTSVLGEIWFAEAEAPQGPWRSARKIVSHERYSFYNPTQHPFFDREGGRIIYFEGTYTATFSGNESRTPRYDYNQIMYRLDLSDPHLTGP